MMPFKIVMSSVLLFTLGTGYALSTELNTLLDTSKNAAASNKDASVVDSAPAMEFDRMGVDRASIHLQILQQSAIHFSSTCNGKKNSNGNKSVSASKPG